MSRVYLESVAEGTQLQFRCAGCGTTKSLRDYYAPAVRPYELTSININRLMQVMGAFAMAHEACGTDLQIEDKE